MSTPIIEVRGVSRHYLTRGGTIVRAVDDVSFAVSEGERIGVIGASGSGKTTLSKMLLALDSPTTGQVLYRGLPIEASVRRDFRRDVQIVFQDPRSSLDPQMQVGDIIREPLECLEIEGDHTSRVREVIDMVGLGADFIDRRPHQLSGGQRQRVAIARAMASSPRVLVADEPVSALDMLVRDEILELLGNLTKHEGHALVLVSHDLAVIARLCERVAVMHEGRIIEEGATTKVFSRPEHPLTGALISAVPRFGFQ